jgi:hypothetical protein
MGWEVTRELGWRTQEISTEFWSRNFLEYCHLDDKKEKGE